MKMKDGPILKIEMEPTPDGWSITLTHRYGTGGISPVKHSAPNYERAATLVAARVMVCGVETQPPSPKGRP